METEFLLEVFETLPHGAPGSSTSTERALASVPNLCPEALILDLGCGMGPQTISLARNSQGFIVALDVHSRFLKGLSRKITEQGLSERVWPVHGSMSSLGFRPGCFDLIWSEGSVYLLGLPRALEEWRPYLKSDGCIALTDAAWLKEDPPREVWDFWQREYPGIRGIEENLAWIVEQGYYPVDHFVLPESDWWNCYQPLESRVEVLRRKYAGDRDRIRFLDSLGTEIQMYREYSDWYGYVFYVIQRA